MFSLAFGAGTQDRNGNWLEVCYPRPLLNPASEVFAQVEKILSHPAGANATYVLDPAQLR